MAKRRRRTVSAATRSKLSARAKGRRASAKTRAKESKAQRGKKRSAAQRAAESRRLKGRHHRGVKRSAAQRAAQSRRQRGKHHKGHKLTAAQRKALSARMKGKHHPHHGHPHKTASRSHGRRHIPRRLRRERIFPSVFKHGHNRLRARFKEGKRIRGLRSPFARGRHHLRDWHTRGRGRRR